MRLDFNVLWVDDQPDSVAAQITALTRIMAGEGFELKPTRCIDINEVTDRLRDSLFKDEIDLILVDWNLGQGVKGPTVINRIREYISYKDIVFYSAVIDTKHLKEASSEAGLEGVYVMSRDEMVIEVTNLFHSQIKKVLDLDHTRGIVMGGTSDIDQMARECLQFAHDMLDDAGKQGVLQDMVVLLDGKVPNLAKRVKKLKSAPGVRKIIDDHLTFTANDGLRVLIHILENRLIGDHSAYVDDIKGYIQNVVPKRNDLGHKVVSPEGRPEGVAGAKGKVFNLDELRALRKALLDARQKFRTLRGTLSRPD